MRILRFGTEPERVVEVMGLNGIPFMMSGNISAAAKLGLDHKLPMADGILLATAHAHKFVIWTQDADFKGMKGAKYVEKKKK